MRAWRMGTQSRALQEMIQRQSGEWTEEVSLLLQAGNMSLGQSGRQGREATCKAVDGMPDQGAVVSIAGVDAVGTSAAVHLRSADTVKIGGEGMLTRRRDRVLVDRCTVLFSVPHPSIHRPLSEPQRQLQRS
jgi:hypothetical protein